MLAVLHLYKNCFIIRVDGIDCYIGQHTVSFLPSRSSAILPSVFGSGPLGCPFGRRLPWLSLVVLLREQLLLNSITIRLFSELHQSIPADKTHSGFTKRDVDIARLRISGTLLPYGLPKCFL